MKMKKQGVAIFTEYSFFTGFPDSAERVTKKKDALPSFFLIEPCFWGNAS
jgi:hypothetical protein